MRVKKAHFIILLLFLFLMMGWQMPLRPEAAAPAARPAVVAGPPDAGCTSFCLDNNGCAVYGTNYDYTRGRHDGLVFVNKRNVSKRFPEAGCPGAQAACRRQGMARGDALQAAHCISGG